jgi:hypothetical protein
MIQLAGNYFGNHLPISPFGISRGLTIMTVHDMDKARSTYESFMGALKWAVPLIAIITLFVVALIAP